ncbi:MAG: DUF1311 domain-containing protein [Halobacteriovoraceae bacterium]|jgi:uncharacterized protein YecT (DUF1311 family)|nr:DUF1311 domain-containing protein [Halobacteriovoraceae bacterium]
MKKIIILISFFAATSSFADCSQFTSMSAMLNCIDEEFKIVDRELNEVYQGLMDGTYLSEAEKKQLRKTQREWVKLKTKVCLEEADLEAPGNGTNHSLVNTACEKRFTEEKLDELKDM